jgi:hypothetical protein
MRTLVALLLVGCLGATACGSGGEPTLAGAPLTTSTTSAPTTLPPTTTMPPPTTAPPTTAPPTTAGPVVSPAADGRPVLEQDWIQFATSSGVSLFYPSARVERIGFHQSNHEGAQQIDPLPDAVRPVTMATRDRLSGDRSAADVVSDPALEVRAPVSGRVVAANSYVLYCDYTDELVFIEPDEHPGWRIKVLHVVGVQVAPGDRVVAGQTPIALHPHQLPFGSQVDDYRTVDPPWPHVHIEVVDLSIPDVPNPGSGGDC